MAATATSDMAPKVCGHCFVGGVHGCQQFFGASIGRDTDQGAVYGLVICELTCVIVLN